jgi:hypothetical protein
MPSTKTKQKLFIAYRYTDNDDGFPDFDQEPASDPVIAVMENEDAYDLLIDGKSIEVAELEETREPPDQHTATLMADDFGWQLGDEWLKQIGTKRVRLVIEDVTP